MKKGKLFVLMAALMSATFLNAGTPFVQCGQAWSMLQIAIVPDSVALVPSDLPIFGLNIEPFCGMQDRVAIFNIQPLYGNSCEVTGLSLQGVGFTDEMIGLQTGVVNINRYFEGLDIAVLTSAWENHGMQIGLVNLSGEAAIIDRDDCDIPPAARGVQVGLVNCTTTGFQFGLVNYNANSCFPWMLLFNCSL